MFAVAVRSVLQCGLLSALQGGEDRGKVSLFYPPMCLGCGLASVQQVSSRGKHGRRLFTLRALNVPSWRDAAAMLSVQQTIGNHNPLHMNLVISIMQRYDACGLVFCAAL